MKEAIIFISIMSTVLFFVISIVRIMMMLFLAYTIRKYKALLSLFKRDHLDNNTYVPASNREDELLRNKDKEKKLEEEQNIYVNVQKMPRNVEFEEPNYKKEIVGIAKPIGKWTSMIIGQKVTYMMQEAENLKKQNSAGYWTNKIHSFDKSNSKGKSRQKGD